MTTHDQRQGGEEDDPAAPLARNPRREAQDLVGNGFDARVLEPSPPAVTDPQWFADDPVAGPATGGRRLVSPVAGDGLTWERWLTDRPQQRAWAAARWLGAYRRLGPPPPTYTETRLAMHRLVVYAVSPARQHANGKMALRFTFGGLGTPFFGADEQVRIAGTTLLRQRGGTAEAAPVGSLNQAAELLLDGPPDTAWAEPFDTPAPGDLDEPLPLDPEAAALLGDWYGFAWSVLEAVRAEPASVDASRVQLWPEHFDAAFECLSEQRRVVLGASPGDAAVPEPYLYVLPEHVDAARADEFWNASTFRGAILPLRALLDEDDQRAAALEFLRRGRALLER
ncbi:MAG TPA: hypothetical protein VF486_10405 [Actinomycetes bacterium]